MPYITPDSFAPYSNLSLKKKTYFFLPADNIPRLLNIFVTLMHPCIKILLCSFIFSKWHPIFLSLWHTCVLQMAPHISVSAVLVFYKWHPIFLSAVLVFYKWHPIFLSLWRTCVLQMAPNISVSLPCLCFTNGTPYFCVSAVLVLQMAPHISVSLPYLCFTNGTPYFCPPYLCFTNGTPYFCLSAYLCFANGT